jgi:hypothetical protein
MRALPCLFLALSISLASLPVSAEIAPEHYVDMQANAPEALRIDVVDVDVEWCLFDCEKRDVVVKAQVVGVIRSTAGVEVGDEITIKYVHRDPPRGWVGPRPTPLLSPGETVAYLSKTDAGHFRPAARGNSFRTLTPEPKPEAKPADSGRWELDFYRTDESPDPVACEVDSDCIGDTTLGKAGCCNEPTTIRPHAKKYRAWAGKHSASDVCREVTCPRPPNPAQPAECYFQVSCVKNTCVNACK